MNASPSPSPETDKGTRRAWPLVVGIVGFAVLMAFRYELSSMWARAAVAGCAFAGLGWAFIAWRRPRK